MEEGINEEFIDELADEKPVQQEEPLEESQGEEPQEESDFITELLKSRGIEDKSKIKFENEDGEVEEKDWDNLDDKEKFNIIQSSEATSETGLDETEIQLINAIRTSGMNPQEYLLYVGNQGVQQYLQNNSQEPAFEVDLYSDDELYLMDLMSRTGDISEDDAVDALQKAKSNEELYKKQVKAIRNEYKQMEQENQMQQQLEKDLQAQLEYALFSNLIVDEINNLTDIQGFDLNMDNEDIQTLYDFITGQDAAGNNYLAKALADPRTLVKTAWLALNGDQMINDITNYFQKEISNVRKESYKKGVEDTQRKINGNNIVYKQKSKSASKYVDDLDEF